MWSQLLQIPSSNLIVLYKLVFMQFILPHDWLWKFKQVKLSPREFFPKFPLDPVLNYHCPYQLFIGIHLPKKCDIQKHSFYLIKIVALECAYCLHDVHCHWKWIHVPGHVNYPWTVSDKSIFLSNKMFTFISRVLLFCRSVVSSILVCPSLQLYPARWPDMVTVTLCQPTKLWEGHMPVWLSWSAHTVFFMSAKWHSYQLWSRMAGWVRWQSGWHEMASVPCGLCAVKCENSKAQTVLPVSFMTWCRDVPCGCTGSSGT